MAMTEAEYEHLAERMLTIYEQAENTMLTRISNRLMRGVDTPGWTEKKQAEVGRVRFEISNALRELQSERNSIAREGIYSAYAAGQQEQTTEMQRFVSSLGVGSNVSPNSEKVARILSDLTSSLDAADRNILRRVDDVYANIIGESSARLATGTVTLRQAVQESLNSFANRGITSFVDKSGRSWEMANYAEMALLTAIEKATVEGYVDTMQSYGFELAIVSSHAGACPLCEAWEDVVLSVTGEDENYPSLDEAEGAGLFHPRCLHHLSTYYPDIHRNAKSRPDPVREPSAEYTARSEQRYGERMIRQWKRRMAVAGDRDEERYAYQHVRRWQAHVRQTIRNAPSHLPRKYWREGGRQLLRFTNRKR